MTQDVWLRAPTGKMIQVGRFTEEFPVGKDKQGPICVPFYDRRFISYVAELLKHLVFEGYDVIIMVTGKRRRGKSNMICGVHQAVDPNFPVDNVAFNIKQFYKIFAGNPFADPENGIFPQVNLDESGFALNSRDWMNTVQKRLEKRFEVGGMKREIVSLTLPHRMKLDSAIREDMAMYWINVELYEGKRGMAVLCEGQENKYHNEMYWEHLAVFQFPPLEGPWWDAYEDRKRSFIEGVLSEDLEGDVSERVKTLTEQRNRAMRELYKITHDSHREIARRVDMPLSTVDKILNYVARD